MAKTKTRTKKKKAAPENAKPARYLIIVESRAKAATLQKFLGNDYHVIASFGHVRDLPTQSFGVSITQKFEPWYVVPRDKKRTVRDIKDHAHKSETVYMATDPDREGEAIAWHLIEAAEIDDSRVQRIAFHEITKTAIQKALQEPREIDMNLVESQQARRILDRLVGFKISPLLSKRIRGAVGAGRVQSVALRFVVDREREIRAFVPVEWWTVEGAFSDGAKSKKTFSAVLEGSDEKLEIADKDAADALISRLEGAAHSVAELRERRQQQRAQAPFTTASLQRAASSELSMSPSLTMRVAQQLYEGIAVGGGDAAGLITYMRTDSTQIAAEARTEAKTFIQRRFGDEYVPEKPNVYRTRTRNAQEAHEAVRPTSVYRVPEEIRDDLDSRQYRLYGLIWRRFMASQMASAHTRTVTVLSEIARDGESLPLRFRASATEVIFPGHRVVSRTGKGDDDETKAAREVILGLTKGQALHLRDLAGEQHFTEPPPRFSEASLIRLLEEEGIGRPSTYAPTVRILVSHRYCELERRQLIPTELGEAVTDAMVEYFPGIVDKGFTENLEDNLDRVAKGEAGWIELLDGFWGPFSHSLQHAEENMKKVQQPEEHTGEDCPDCGEELMIRSGRYGSFIGCSNYPECKFRRRLLKKVGVTCPDCEEGDIVERRSRRGRVFYGCSRYPDCEYTTWTRPRPPGESGDQVAAEDDDGSPADTGGPGTSDASTDRAEAEDGGDTTTSDDTAELAEVSPPDTAAG